MKELTREQINAAVGASDSIGSLLYDFAYDVGYTVGYGAGYFYENVMKSNRVVDDLAGLLGE